MIPYALLAVDLLLVAVALTVLGYLIAGAVGLVTSGRRRPRTAGATWRRCDDCRHRWQGTPGREPTAVDLRLRRAVRRAARKVERDVAWARSEGWSRCPSCLSDKVRDSRKQTAR